VTDALHPREARTGFAGKSAPAALLVAAALATAAAVYTLSVSRIAPNPVAQGSLTAIVCLAFVGAGVAALRVPPYARFGLILAAVGFTSLIGVLHDANGSVAYAVGLFLSNLVFAVLVHALLAYPSGKLHTTETRLLVAVAYLNVLLLQAVAVVFDPLTRYHSDHPPNRALIASHSVLATGLEELEAGIAALVALAAAVLLARRARAATPVARRQLAPVLVVGMVALLLFAVGLALAPLSSRAGLLGFGLGLVAALALPAVFLATLVQGRLSRASVGELLLELREPGEAPDLERALQRALGDPSLRLGRVAVGEPGFLDAAGGPLELPEPRGLQVATPILYLGEPIGTLVHDRSLRLRAEQLEAVSAAAGFALANERALHAVELAEKRNRALLDAIPDPMFQVDRDGTFLDVRADDPSQLVQPAEKMIGRRVRDVIPSALADDVMAWLERTLANEGVSAFEYEIEIGGRRRWREARMMPIGPDEAVAIVRDFTEQRRTETEQRRLAAEQAALRRVATLVAGNAPPEHVFQRVTEEVCGLLGLQTVVLHRFEGDQIATIVGKFGAPTGRFELGNVVELELGTALEVLKTGAPARSDYSTLPGEGAAELLELGFFGSVGVPITVAGATWGALVVALQAGEELPLVTEHRLEGFAELVALAVASAHARDELAASRQRIVEASDTERRRLERNLHDGAQQRLVALSLGLRLVQAKLASTPDEARELLDALAGELAAALTELRELAQGIHPAVLTDRGLAPALEVLAARAPVSVGLDLDVSERLPEPVETAAYYTVSEALANVAKHASASSAVVRVECGGGHVAIEVSDDGAGGADADRGSGLRGLRDRVEALDGLLSIESPPGRGTVVRAELPVRPGRLAEVGGGS
jgi:PAS domain S-box-containing protein